MFCPVKELWTISCPGDFVYKHKLISATFFSFESFQLFLHIRQKNPKPKMVIIPQLKQWFQNTLYHRFLFKWQTKNDYYSEERGLSMLKTQMQFKMKGKSINHASFLSENCSQLECCIFSSLYKPCIFFSCGNNLTAHLFPHSLPYSPTSSLTSC